MAVPAYRIRCDWNKDGDFTGTGEDITSDVRTTDRGIVMARTLDLRTRRMKAAVLDLFLKNDDHKYSPSFKSSVLYPNVLPSPDIWVELAYPMDDFTVADSTTLTSRKPSHDDLFAAWSGDTGDFDVLSNKVRTATGADKQAVLDFGETDCFVAVDFTRGDTGSGLILRYVDTSNYLLIRVSANTVYIDKVVAGSKSNIANATMKDKAQPAVAIAWNTGTERTLGAELHGNVIRAFVDGVLQVSGTDVIFKTATKHGIGGKNTHANDRWNDFGGWRSIFRGRIDVISPRPETERQYCYIRAFDEFERLGEHLVLRSAPTGSDSNNADDILGVILDAVDFSSNNRILDTGQNLSKNEHHQKSLGNDGLTEIYQLQDDDVALAYVDGQEMFHYEDSDHRAGEPHTSSIRTWTAKPAGSPAETDILISGDHFEWDDGKQNVENEVYFEWHRLSRTTAVQVWRLETEDRPKIINKATLDLIAVGDDDNIANPIVPDHGDVSSDWDFNTAENGSGTDLLIVEGAQIGTVSATGASDYELDDASRTGANGFDDQGWTDGLHQVRIKDASGTTALAFIGTEDEDSDGTRVVLYDSSARDTVGYVHMDTGFDESDTPLTYNVYDVTVELVEGFDGNTHRVSIYNGSGSNGYITFLRLRADKLTQSSKTYARAESTGSQIDVGRRRVKHTTKHIDRHGEVQVDGRPADAGSALGRAYARIDQRHLRKEIIICSMVNSTRAALMQILHRSLSDRIRLTYSPMDVDDDYDIEGQKLTITEGGLKIDCEWTMQQTVGSPWDRGRYDQAQWA